MDFLSPDGVVFASGDGYLQTLQRKFKSSEQVAKTKPAYDWILQIAQAKSKQLCLLKTVTVEEVLGYNILPFSGFVYERLEFDIPAELREAFSEAKLGLEVQLRSDKCTEVEMTGRRR